MLLSHNFNPEKHPEVGVLSVALTPANILSTPGFAMDFPEIEA
jgi:hypothetical protein